MATIKVLPHNDLCPQGAEFEADSNKTLCDNLLTQGINIEHACEKSCACTTCHVVIRQGFDTLDEAKEEEEDLLDKAWGLEPNSRLSCQTKISPEMQLIVEIPRYTINHAKEH